MGDTCGQLFDRRIVPRLSQEVFGLLQHFLNNAFDLIQVPIQFSFPLFEIVRSWLCLFATGSPKKSKP